MRQTLHLHSLRFNRRKGGSAQALFGLLVCASFLGTFFCWAFPGNSIAQEVPTIIEIEVVGNKTTSTDLIKSVASLLPGSQLNSSTIRDAVTRLDGLALFEDISVLVEDIEGGVKLYIRVKERAKLESLTFEGNGKISKDDLQDIVKIVPGSYVSAFDVYSKRQSILRAYADKGYFLTVVDYSATYNPDSSSLALIYKITENEKVKVRKVFVTGAVQMETDKLVGSMSNRKKGFLKSSNYNKDKYSEDLEKIIAEYHKHGFIDAYLISDSIVIDTAVNRLDIYLETYEGPRYYFGDVSFTDNDIYTDEQLNRTLKFNRWDIFSQEDYDESIFEIYTAYQERGHLHLRVLDKKTFRDSIIDINYEIIEGLPSKINLVNITGNVKTKDKIIRRELSVRPGQVFHRSLLIRSARDAMALNYFTNVVPDVKNLPNGDIDVEFKIEEKQTGQLNAGAGYSARDKLVGTFGMGIPNLFGNGQQLNFNLEFGGRRNSSQISFTEPWMFGRPTLFGADLFNTRRLFEGIYTEGRRGGSLRTGKRLTWPDNYFRASLSYRLEGNRFNEFDSSYVLSNTYHTSTLTDSTFLSDHIDTMIVDTGGPIDTTFAVVNDSTKFPTSISNALYGIKPGTVLDLGERWNIASIISVSINRDSRNLPEFATAGSRFRYTVSKAGGFMGGYWNYTKHFTEYSKFIRLYKGIALAARFQFGAVLGKDDRRILETERFAPGGTSFLGIVRGYEDGSLTPDTLLDDLSDTTINRTVLVNQRAAMNIDSVTVDTTIDPPRGSTIRGNFMFVTNWEISVPLATNSLYFLTFFDAGNSWTRWEDIWRREGLFPGAGAGFRLAVPGIGTIGFDFAWPLRKRIAYNRLGVLSSNDMGMRTHFQVGTVFR